MKIDSFLLSDFDVFQLLVKYTIDYKLIKKNPNQSQINSLNLKDGKSFKFKNEFKICEINSKNNKFKIMNLNSNPLYEFKV
ncbi:hypothetical protein A3K93_12790 [Acinetobacter sp. NCu2D-2]|nr:hypothetical protein A3K93_12790 [Acinetobacter sp. NCu2D-2]